MLVGEKLQEFLKNFMKINYQEKILLNKWKKKLQYQMKVGQILYSLNNMELDMSKVMDGVNLLLWST